MVSIKEYEFVKSIPICLLTVVPWAIELSRNPSRDYKGVIIWYIIFTTAVQ